MGTGWVAGSVNGSPVVREKAEPCFGHSISSSSAQTSPSAIDASAWVHWSPMTYQASSPIRTTARRYPATSNRLAEPGFTSSTEQTLISATTVTSGTDTTRVGPGPPGLELPGHSGPQRLLLAGERQAGDDILEEPEHDEALRHVGREAAALQVVELVLVDRPDGRGVGAPDVVGL